MNKEVWFWIFWEVLAGVLVAVGCVGELYLFKKPAKPGHEEHHRGMELKFILAVSIGVTMELVGLAHTIPEAIRLERDVARANERTTSLMSSNLVMEQRILDTQRELDAEELAASSDPPPPRVN